MNVALVCPLAGDGTLMAFLQKVVPVLRGRMGLSVYTPDPGGAERLWGKQLQAFPLEAFHSPAVRLEREVTLFAADSPEGEWTEHLLRYGGFLDVFPGFLDRRACLSALDRAAGIVVHSDEDKQRIKALMPDQNVFWIPLDDPAGSADRYQTFFRFRGNMPCDSFVDAFTDQVMAAGFTTKRHMDPLVAALEGYPIPSLE